ncbi:F0F1 ATP synthase subunit B [Dictyobacter arantiisoli]|uniref:ATP synthase subunit b n=1 Tax=Dictyobacter arantiisoli TaxID=2014874 RepID=A0A5A5TD27_9CHLR|nr:F0F1 ATP synthase subunit B [Dictyobacter arantiisoli]GCF09362.1 ATP synthase subunit b [Dictyobacter arantiisoli]
MQITFTLASAAMAAESTGGIGALGINAAAFLSQLVSFLIVFFVLGKYVLPVVQRTLAKRQALIREGIENAEKAKRDLAEATNNAERIILDAKRQAQDSIERATKNAAQVAQQIETEARERAEKISQQQIARIQQEANRARLELSRDVINLSIDAASKVISRSVDSKDNRRLVEEFVTANDQARNN